VGELCEGAGLNSIMFDPPPRVPLGAAGVGAGGALLAGVPEGAGLGAPAAAAHAAAAPAAHLAVGADAGRRLRGAVAVVAHVAGVALALAAVAFTVTWGGGGSQRQ